jgi:tight adherence protein B
MNLQAYYPYFLYVLAAVTAVFLAEGLYLLFAGTVDRRMTRNRRMRAMADGISTEQVLLELKRERGISADGELRLDNRLRRLLVQSGLRLTLLRFIFLVLLLGAAIYGGLFVLTRLGPLLLLLPTIIGGLGIPYLVVRTIRTRRQFKFVEQLPDALDVIVRSLRSGHPVPVAMALASREMPDPLGTEFGIAVDEMTYGLEAEQALANIYQRCGVPELGLVVTAMSLQTATGGNLSVILSNLAKTVRDRFALGRKVRALSAEGKISAWGMTILPIVLALYINLVNPRYYGDVWTDPIFIPIMFAVIFWSLVGDFIMFKMINFKY